MCKFLDLGCICFPHWDLCEVTEGWLLICCYEQCGCERVYYTSLWREHCEYSLKMVFLLGGCKKFWCASYIQRHPLHMPKTCECPLTRRKEDCRTEHFKGLEMMRLISITWIITKTLLNEKGNGRVHVREGFEDAEIEEAVTIVHRNLRFIKTIHPRWPHSRSSRWLQCSITTPDDFTLGLQRPPLLLMQPVLEPWSPSWHTAFLSPLLCVLLPGVLQSNA